MEGDFHDKQRIDLDALPGFLSDTPTAKAMRPAQNTTILYGVACAAVLCMYVCVCISICAMYVYVYTYIYIFI